MSHGLGGPLGRTSPSSAANTCYKPEGQVAREHQRRQSQGQNEEAGQSDSEDGN